MADESKDSADRISEREERQIDVLKIQEDARQADLQHVEGMTKLELEAGRDLAMSGKAV